MADPDFGLDLDCGPDGLSPHLALVGGRLGLVQAVMRRFDTTRGSLIDDPDYGYDLQLLVGQKIGPVERFGHEQAIAAEARKDERILRATARLTLTGSALRLQLALEDDAGPFTLVVEAKDLSLQLLAVT